jgi:hypothetical protein
MRENIMYHYDPSAAIHYDLHPWRVYICMFEHSFIDTVV